MLVLVCLCYIVAKWQSGRYRLISSLNKLQNSWNEKKYFPYGSPVHFKSFTETWYPSNFIPVTYLPASAQDWFWHPFCVAWGSFKKSCEKVVKSSTGTPCFAWELQTNPGHWSLNSTARAQPCTLLFRTLPRLYFRVWLRTCFVTASLVRDHWTHCWCGSQNQTCSALLVLTTCLAVVLNPAFTFPYGSMQPCCPVTDCSW